MLRVTQKTIVVAAVTFCAVLGAAFAIPAYAQSFGAVPAAPTNLVAASTSNSVTLTWTAPNDNTRTGYMILSRIPATQPGFSVLVNNVGSYASSYTITGLEPRTTYQFTMVAVNSNGASGISNIVTISTAGSQPPMPPPITTPMPPPITTPTPTDIAGLARIIENLGRIIEGLILKITALEAEIASLRGALGGQLTTPITDSGNFIPIYYGATSGSNLAQKSHYERQLFLEGFTGRLTQTLVLPYDVYLTMDECGDVQALYRPDYKRITICYEFITFLEGRLAPYSDTSAELSQNVNGFVTWVMLHELGHALIDVYDLPVTGNEEDAVDQFATIIALEYIPPDQAGNVLYATLLAWSLGQNSIFPTEGQLAGPHSLASQRFYNVACWMYGSNVHGYSNLVDNNILPEERAKQCQSEYERTSESWYRLVSPFLINPGSVPPP